MIGPVATQRRFLWGVLVSGLAWGMLSGCSGAQAVPRRNGDTIEMGRHIPAQAYAWYARGLYFERGGHLREAEFAYQAAIDVDRKSGSAWASLVRVRCQEKSGKALEAADQGLSQALRHAPILTERARCLLATWGDRLPQEKATALVRQALDDARAAVDREPSYVQANQLVVEIYRALSENENAERWEHAYKLFAGVSLSDSTSAAPQVDEHLTHGRLSEARTQAVGIMSPGELAVRAFALGQEPLAQEQAKMTLRASPEDADANLVLFLTSLEDPTSVSDKISDALSPLGVLVFVAHLKRTVGSAAAHTFWQKYSQLLVIPADPLAQILLDYLELDAHASPSMSAAPID